MLDVYRLLAKRVGAVGADELAEELRTWHDAMVRHQRVLVALQTECAGGECPHAEAAELWARARRALGRDAEELTFLRSSAMSRRRG